MNKPIRCFLILFNLSKPINFGNLIRTANAFGVTPIAVGKKDVSRCGATARTRRTKVLHYYTLEEAVDFVRSQGCSLVGVEINPTSQPVTNQPFNGSTAFLMGNEGEGLIAKQIAMCDALVYIPQYGDAVSLNVNVAAGIVLHQFAHWAGFPEARRQDNKYATDDVAVVDS